MQIVQQVEICLRCNIIQIILSKLNANTIKKKDFVDQDINALDIMMKMKKKFGLIIKNYYYLSKMFNKIKKVVIKILEYLSHLDSEGKAM